MTTAASVRASITELARKRMRMLAQGRGFISPVTDDLDPFEAPSQLHAVVESGSIGGGGRGRWASERGLTLLAGFIYGDQRAASVNGRSTWDATLALRYAPAGLGASGPFVEAGGALGRIADFTLTRVYANGDGLATGRGTTHGHTSSFYGRAGYIWQLTPVDQLGGFVQYGRERQSLGGYVEPLDAANPFEAHVAPGVDRLDVGRAGVRFSHGEPQGLDFGFNLTAAHAFAEGQSLDVAVPGFGIVLPHSLRKQTWLEFGLHAGYAVTRHITFSLFATGVAGSDIVGDGAHGGADFRLTF